MNKNRAIIDNEITQGAVGIGLPKAYNYDAALVETAKAIVEEELDIINTNGLAEKVVHNTIYKLNAPLDVYGAVDNGTEGQILRTKGDGNTEWVVPSTPSDEQVAEVVTQWLDGHPEATTTVEDGSLTRAKFATALDLGTAVICQTEQQMIADTSLKVGYTVATKGYWTVNDGGGALYNIREKEASDVHTITLAGSTVDVVGDNVSVIAIGNWLDPDNVSLVAERINPITNTVGEYVTFDSAVLDADAFNVYTGRTYVIDETITLTSQTNIFNKVFSNCTFILNTTMFTWSAAYMPIPDFVNCVFIGNGNYIVDEDLYCSKSKFVNCIFKDCGAIQHGKEFQSARFINCRFIGTTNLVQAKILNDFEMDSCQFEGDFKACIADTSEFDYPNRQSSVQAFRLINSIIEGQPATAPVLFKIAVGGQVYFKNNYFEEVHCGLIDFINPIASPILVFEFNGNKFSGGRNPLIDIDAGYEQKDRVFVNISNNSLVDGVTNDFVSTTNFKHIIIANNFIDSHIPLTNDISNVELGQRNNIKAFEFWCDGTLASSTSDTINKWNPTIGEVFNLFAGAGENTKYARTISVHLIESTADSNNANGQTAWLRERVYGNSGAYYDYLDILQINGSAVTQGKYKIRVSYIA